MSLSRFVPGSEFVVPDFDHYLFRKRASDSVGRCFAHSGVCSTIPGQE